MMRRTVFLLSLGGLAGCLRDHRPRLNVFNWSNYVAPDTIPGFERESGARVRYAIYESNEELMAKVFSGNSGWDVVFPSNNFVGPLRQLQLLHPIRREWLPGIAHLETRFQQPPWDPKLEWSVPYMWGATGILYNRAKLAAIDSWSALWSERLRGRMTMLDDPADVFAACLKKLGYSVNSTEPRQLAEAREQAVRQKPLLRAYLNAEVRDQVVAGDVLAAQLWTTTAQQAIDDAPDLAFCYPLEGYSVYADSAVILRESRRERLAHEFLNYLLRPEVSAAIVSATKT
ncbi:MAG: spermidine/putrescine ABC transporter substrate-binding protein, partial [Acidobacteria bacterium]|nr:spermidine/putrescine ABC transporter substrate-binding protein [Acidobacteriota bacterium]